jgi:hypothetical protein
MHTSPVPELTEIPEPAITQSTPPPPLVEQIVTLPIPLDGLIAAPEPAIIQFMLLPPPPPLPNRQEYVEKVTPFCTIGTNPVEHTDVVNGRLDIGILGINYI